MDIFKFTNPTSPMKMEGGQIINGLTSKMWVERYRDAGEFTLVAPISSGLKEVLPIGTFISHTETFEIMVVENHEINDNAGKASEVKVTGRGLETIFSQRVVGQVNTYPLTSPADYSLAAGYTAAQVVEMLCEHTEDDFVVDANEAFPYIIIYDPVGITVGDQVARKIPRGELYKAALDLMAIDDLGIKIIRPGAWSADNPKTAVMIHRGVDQSSLVSFSYDTGEITTADYIWSDKKYKNAALITGTWIEIFYNPDSHNLSDRRVLWVDGKDIDKVYTSAPTGTTLTSVISLLQQRGKEALASQNNVVLTKADISKKSTTARYRTDYDVGDIIMVNGDYNEASKMRVSEFVEIEDNTGRSSYPTLTSL